MDYKIKNTIAEIKEIAEELKDAFPFVPERDILHAALQHQANRIQIAANVISSTDAYPSALEMIAIKLQELNGGGPIITKV